LPLASSCRRRCRWRRCAALSSSRCASWLLRVASVTLLSCATLESSRRAGWLLRVTLHLSPYHVAPPSRPLVAPAGCCLLHASVALSGCTALLSSRHAG
jgi:hypothetical protein